MRCAQIAFLAVPALGGQYLNQKYKDNLLLDLWTPPNYPCGVSADAQAPNSPTPLVVHIYGGAWLEGSKDDVCMSGKCGTIIPDVAKSTRGAVLAMNYQLTPTGAHMPKQIQDVIDAVNWVLKDASKYNVDPSKVVCSGQSAGAHLCALLATYSAEQHNRPDGTPPLAILKAAMPFFAPTDILNMQQDADKDSCVTMNHDGASSPESALVGASGVGGIKAVRANPGKYPEIYNTTVNANPITFVSKSSPPMFIRAGGCDQLVPHVQSEKLSDALKAMGVEADLHIIDGAKHACQPASAWKSHSAAGTAWLIEKLGGTPAPSPTPPPGPSPSPASDDCKAAIDSACPRGVACETCVPQHAQDLIRAGCPSVAAGGEQICLQYCNSRGVSSTVV